MKINKEIKRRKDAFILGSLLLFHLVNNYIWLRMDTMPLIWDAHKTFMENLRFFEEYRNFSWSFFQNVIKINRFYPIFVSMITAPFYAIFGRSQDAGVMVNSAIFLGILILSVYGIGKKLVNRQTGLLSAFIVTMYPIIFNQSRIYLLDLPLTAMVSLSIYLLLCTNYFEIRKYSILFGVAFGFSFLIKFNFIGFIIAPFLVVACKTFSLSFRERKVFFSKDGIPNRKSNFGIAILIGIGISLLYYIPRFIVTYKNLLSFSSYPTFFSTRFDFLEYSYSFYDASASLWWYLQATVNNGIAFFFFAIFFGGVFLFLKRRLRDANLLLLLWVIIPYILLSFVVRRGLWASTELRYVMPALPSIAIISAIGILSIPNRILKVVLIMFVFLFGLIQFFAVSYGISWLPEEFKIPVAVPRWVRDREDYFTSHMLEEVVLFRQNIDVPSSHYSHPISIEWGDKEIFKIIKNDSKQLNRRIIISVLTDTTEIWSPLQYEAYIEKLPFDIFCDAIDIYWRNEVPYSRLILQADYIITKKGGVLAHPSFIDKVNEAMDFFNQYVDRFILLKKIKAPDESEFFLYKKKRKEYLNYNVDTLYK